MSIIDYKDFYLTRKCVEARSKQLLKKQRKGNKSNAAEALTNDDLGKYSERKILTSRVMVVAA